MTGDIEKLSIPQETVTAGIESRWWLHRMWDGLTNSRNTVNTGRTADSLCSRVIIPNIRHLTNRIKLPGLVSALA